MVRRILGPQIAAQRNQAVAALGAVVAAAVAATIIGEALPWRDQPFAGFFVYPNLNVAPVRRMVWEEPIPRSPVPRLVDAGGIPVVSQADFALVLQHLWERERAGGAIEFTLSYDGREAKVTRRLREFTGADLAVTFWLPFVIGLVYVAMGVFVMAVRPEHPAGPRLFYLSYAIGLFYLTLFDAITTGRFFVLWACFPIFGPLGLHFFVTFPRKLEMRQRRDWLIYGSYGAAVLLCAMRLWWDFEPARARLLSVATHLFNSMCFTGIVVLLIWHYHSARKGTLRNQVKVVFAGLLLTAALIVAHVFATLSAGTIPTEIVMIPSGAFPILMAYALVRNNVFDFDRAMRWSLTYLGVTGPAIAIYFILVAVAGAALKWFAGSGAGTAGTVVAALGVAALFHPMRMAVQRAVDRFFYPQAAGAHSQAIRFSAALAEERGFDATCQFITQEFARAMGASACYLWSRAPTAPVDRLVLTATAEAKPGEGAAPPGELFLDDPVVTTAASRHGLWTESPAARPGNPSSPGAASLQVDALLPLHHGGRIVGLAGLRCHERDAFFPPWQADFAATAAPVAALALENACLIAQQSRQAALAALGEVASMMVHEIKNPLGIIKVSAGTIKRRFQNGEAGHELAGFIEEEVDRMNRHIQQILNFAKLPPPDLQPVDLTAAAGTIAAPIAQSLASAGATLHVETPAAPLVAAADPDQLRQVILNLVLNAKQAAGPGAEIWLRIRRDTAADGPPRAIVEIEDNGPGVPAEQEAALFKPFVARSHGGSGLGLSIVRQIVENHGGGITYVRGPRGAIFRAALPLAAANTTAPAKEAPRHPPAALQGSPGLSGSNT